MVEHTWYMYIKVKYVNIVFIRGKHITIPTCQYLSIHMFCWPVNIYMYTLDGCAGSNAKWKMPWFIQLMRLQYYLYIEWIRLWGILRALIKISRDFPIKNICVKCNHLCLKWALHRQNYLLKQIILNLSFQILPNLCVSHCLFSLDREIIFAEHHVYGYVK